MAAPLSIRDSREKSDRVTSTRGRSHDRDAAAISFSAFAENDLAADGLENTGLPSDTCAPCDQIRYKQSIVVGRQGTNQAAGLYYEEVP